MNEHPFRVEVEGFSGPLDVLCHLLENREIEASAIRVSEIIGTYSRFLTLTGRLSIYETAEFLDLCSRILLGKIKALLPGQAETNEISENAGILIAEEALFQALERYRPYREAARMFRMLQEQAENHFIRVSEGKEPAIFELGDLYSLCRQWWKIYGSCACARQEVEQPHGSCSDGFPDPVPEEEQVEERIRELSSRFREGTEIPLAELVPRRAGRTKLVVTLLALLEMCRLGFVCLTQEKGFGTLKVRSLEHVASDGPIY